MAQYLVGVYAVSGGLQGEDLGSDEQEIVLFSWVVVDVRKTQVVCAQTHVVKPRGDVNDNTLSEACRGELGLTEEQLRMGQPLEQVVEQFDQLVCGCVSGGSFRLVTDGQLHLRQALQPEACKKSLALPHYFYSFLDLRKHFAAFYRDPSAPLSLQHMLQHLNIEGEKMTQDCEFATQQASNMAKIILRMLTDGHTFENAEEINTHLEPGICTKSEVVENNTVVRARGLPWQSSDQDIAKFFRGLNIVRGGVALCLSQQGRRNGEALVRFESEEHRDMALKRHKHHIGPRYIEVYRATGDDFIGVAGGSNNEAQAFLSRGAQVIVRMRGLPYDCNPKQVLSFFSSGEAGCEVVDGEEGVLFVKKADGRATGDAFVLFRSEETAQRALHKHRQLIGSRYIELFRSTTAEVQQVLNRCVESRGGVFEGVVQAPLIASLPQVPLLPQGALLAPCSVRKDCIRLRGLPFEAQVEHILEFLGDHAKQIVFQGVHMVYNAQGHPSGEAFIQMESEAAAFAAAAVKHHRYMASGKKQRYIEVFQCSVDDMTLVLSGLPPLAPPVPRPPLLSAAGANMLPPAAYGAAFPYGAGGAMVAAPMTPRLPAYYSPVIYWPYPSPPVSPTAHYYSAAHSSQAALLPGECLQVAQGRGGEVGRGAGSDALLSFPAARLEAERALHEKSRQQSLVASSRYIELFMA